MLRREMSAICTKIPNFDDDSLTLEQRLIMVFMNLSSRDLFDTIQIVVNLIKVGEKIQVVVPIDYSHDDEGKHDQKNIEKLQDKINGYMSEFPSVIMTLYPRNDQYDEMVVDIKHV